MVIVFPHLVKLAAMHDARMSALIKKWCKEFDWGFIDLIEHYKNYGLEALRVNSKDPIHPNSLGHRIAAETIVKELKW